MQFSRFQLPPAIMICGTVGSGACLAERASVKWVRTPPSTYTQSNHRRTWNISDNKLFKPQRDLGVVHTQHNLTHLDEYNDLVKICQEAFQ